MSSSREITAFGVAGFLVSLLIIAAINIGPLIIPSGKAMGVLEIKITDAPVRELTHLHITIDSFEVHRKETGAWISIPIDGGSVSFDLLQLKNKNITEDAAISPVPTGNYTMIRMRIVEGLEFTNATLNDDPDIQLDVPSEKIKISVHFEIKEGESTTIILDITADSAHIVSNPQKAILRPVIKPIVMPP